MTCRYFPSTHGGHKVLLGSTEDGWQNINHRAEVSGLSGPPDIHSAQRMPENGTQNPGRDVSRRQRVVCRTQSSEPGRSWCRTFLPHLQKMVTRVPGWSPSRCPLLLPPSALVPPQSSGAWFLGLSPSLRSSPVDDVTVGGVVPPVLFEEVQICCSSPLQEPTLSSTLSRDHSYQSQKGVSTGDPGPQQDESRGEKQQPDTSAGTELKMRPPGSVTKSRACSKVRAGKVKPPASGHPPSAHTSGKAGKPLGPTRLQPMRKKCVNGFIMFCRLNRKAYLRVNPGTASTAATRDLADLWRNMSLQERRPYCMKALRFSLNHDRLVKQRNVSLLHGDVSPPKPLTVLLAEKSCPVTSVPRYSLQDTEFFVHDL
ncbi:unnamed protein product [Staurois parvus]|uniref:HMG box domain-containing protein n=1 Tax=Staurois parvus TaxID=386267 RepID=A0ABN9FTE2_9NEOB|nr:unnamed protein product [Staurois parvus]